MKDSYFYLRNIDGTASSRIDPTKVRPHLSFRYYVEFLNYPEFENVYFSTTEVKLPTLQRTSDGLGSPWSMNTITIEFYKFDISSDVENNLIAIFNKNEHLQLKINFVDPDGKTVNGYWHVIGEIYKCDFGNLAWKSDDVVMVTLTVVPLECNYVNLIKE